MRVIIENQCPTVHYTIIQYNYIDQPADHSKEKLSSFQSRDSVEILKYIDGNSWEKFTKKSIALNSCITRQVHCKRAGMFFTKNSPQAQQTCNLMKGLKHENILQLDLE